MRRAALPVASLVAPWWRRALARLLASDPVPICVCCGLAARTQHLLCGALLIAEEIELRRLIMIVRLD